jgi:hypothetical protein
MTRTGNEDVSVQGDNICDKRNNRLCAGTMRRKRACTPEDLPHPKCLAQGNVSARRRGSLFILDRYEIRPFHFLATTFSNIFGNDSFRKN